jgi:hypothetical protein
MFLIEVTFIVDRYTNKSGRESITSLGVELLQTEKA